MGATESTLPLAVMSVRLLLAAVFGALLGYERETHASDAGLRTHMLIAIAACLFTMLAFEIYERAGGSASGTADPIRIIEAITAGIAFLGAGAIFTQGATAKNLTTGAGMWLAGAIGTATGLGLYELALVAALAGVTVLWIIKLLVR